MRSMRTGLVNGTSRVTLPHPGLIMLISIRCRPAGYGHMTLMGIMNQRRPLRAVFDTAVEWLVGIERGLFLDPQTSPVLGCVETGCRYFGE